jgi:hypothetical protein
MYEGISPSEFIRADEVERAILLQAGAEAQQVSMDRQRLLANMIIEELSKALNKKK